MKISTQDGQKTVTDLQAAYIQAKDFQDYGGNQTQQEYWLFVYYQLKALKQPELNGQRIKEKFEAKANRSSNLFDELWNDPKARNLNFCGAGYMSKASSNYRSRHREQIGKAAIESVKNKLISKIIDFAIKKPEMNGWEFLEIMEELDRNKNLSDSNTYYEYGENGLMKLHSSLLLWLKNYAPNYVASFVGVTIGQRWAKRQS